MCVVSMVMDDRYDHWRQRYPWTTDGAGTNPPFGIPVVPIPTQEEIQEFRDLLERAREYDRLRGEPDCELEEKRQRLLDLAAELEVDISFV